MLKEADWLTAKYLMEAANRVSRDREENPLIPLINKFFSCQEWRAYSWPLKKDAINPIGHIENLRGIQVIGFQDNKLTELNPIKSPNRSLKNLINSHDGLQAPDLIPSANRPTPSLHQWHSGDIFCACTVPLQESFLIHGPAGLMLAFKPTKHFCPEKMRLLETLLPVIGRQLYLVLFYQKSKTPLTPREQQVMSMVVNGNQVSQIAEALNVTTHTVNYHLGKIYRKLKVKNRQQALIAAQQAGLADKQRVDILPPCVDEP